MVKTSKFQFKWKFIIRILVVNSLAFSLVNSVVVGVAITEALIYILYYIPGVKFKIAERGGMTLERQLIKSNPTASSECHRKSCGLCEQPEGNGGSKRCQKTSVCYQYKCRYPDCQAFYTGETSKNLMTRNDWHQSKYKSKKLQKDSFLFKHQQE